MDYLFVQCIFFNFLGILYGLQCINYIIAVFKIVYYEKNILTCIQLPSKYTMHSLGYWNILEASTILYYSNLTQILCLCILIFFKEDIIIANHKLVKGLRNISVFTCIALTNQDETGEKHKGFYSMGENELLWKSYIIHIN